MEREEALLLQQQSRNYRRKGNWAYDDAKKCDTFDYSGKDYFYEKSREFWILSDQLNNRLREAGFAELIDEPEDDD